MNLRLRYLETTGAEVLNLMVRARHCFHGDFKSLVERSLTAQVVVQHVSENASIADRLMTLYSEGGDTVQPALSVILSLLCNQDAIKRVLSHYGDGNVLRR